MGLSSTDTGPAPARNRAQRRADVLAKLESEVDLWVASASAEGDAYLVPLSFAWDGARLTIATPKSSVTGRNLARRGWARVAIGPTRDVVMIEGPVEVMPVEENDELAAAHAAKAGFDAREARGRWIFLRVTPRNIQAWREVNELEGRHVMIDGEWLGMQSVVTRSGRAPRSSRPPRSDRRGRPRGGRED